MKRLENLLAINGYILKRQANHLVFCHIVCGDNFVIAKSASDHRAEMNNIKMLRRHVEKQGRVFKENPDIKVKRAFSNNVVIPRAPLLPEVESKIQIEEFDEIAALKAYNGGKDFDVNSKEACGVIDESDIEAVTWDDKDTGFKLTKECGGKKARKALAETESV